MRPPEDNPLLWPSPLVDPSLTLDPFVRGRSEGERVVLVLESGGEVAAEVSRSGRGIRLRLGVEVGETARTSPMLLDAPPGAPVPPALDDASGLPELAPFSFGELVVLFGRRAMSGRLLDGDGEHAGWLLVVPMGPDAGVYGGGESFQGPNIRGRLRRVLNAECHGVGGTDVSYIGVPFFWSDAGWGLLFHTGTPMRADLGATHGELAAFAVEDPELDVFIEHGDGAAHLAAYHARTGAVGRLPSWAFGVWTSRCSYLSEREVTDVVDGYDAAGCPVDVVHVDAWVEGNVIADLACNWRVDRARFTEGWGRRLADRGVRLSLWHNPYVMAESALAADLASRGLLVRSADGGLARTPDKRDRHLIDFTNPDAVAWWKAQVRGVMASEGNAAFKPDFAEELPADAVLFDGRQGWEARNEYALRYQRATAEAMAGVVGEGSFALFCRSGTAGSQRHPCHWVGDTPSTWEGMAGALRACLSLSLSGFGIVGHDVGGFYTPASFGPMQEAMARMDGSGIVADVDPRLFARWTQWGAFSPMLRFHGTGRREPWAYPSPFGDIAVSACRLRAALRSYLVAAASAAASVDDGGDGGDGGGGLPMMRPMVLAYPGDRAARDASLQYLLGPDVLVAPVLSASGAVTLWVPPGEWEPLVGLWPVSGPGWVTISCPDDAFPAWVRAGAPWPLDGGRESA